jgi:hypothetical protein
MMIDTWATVQQIQEDTGLTPAEILQLNMGEYARLSNRPAPAESAVAALDREYAASAPQGQDQPPAPAQEAQQPPQGITDDQFIAWRQNRVSGGEGVGILNQAGQVAARNQAGRTHTAWRTWSSPHGSKAGS